MPTARPDAISMLHLLYLLGMLLMIIPALTALGGSIDSGLLLFVLAWFGVGPLGALVALASGARRNAITLLLCGSALAGMLLVTSGLLDFSALALTPSAIAALFFQVAYIAAIGWVGYAQLREAVRLLAYERCTNPSWRLRRPHRANLLHAGRRADQASPSPRLG